MSKYQGKSSFREIIKRESKQNKEIRKNKKLKYNTLIKPNNADYLKKMLGLNFKSLTDKTVMVSIKNRIICYPFHINDNYLSDFHSISLNDLRYSK